MKKIALTAALLGVFGIAQAGNLVVNGSFEDQSLASHTWNIFHAVTGWTTDGGPGVELRNAIVGDAYAGDNYVELDSYSNSSMSQAITTTAGASYTLSFAYSPRSGVDAASNPIEVLWDGHSLATITASGVGVDGQDWKVHTFTVSGLGLDRLTFRAVGTDDSLGGSLDAVSLTSAVPEPSTYALALAGLAMFFGLRLRRSQR